MAIAISVIGFIGLIVCLVWLIVCAIKKKRKRSSIIGLVVAFAMFIGGGFTQANLNSSQIQSTAKSNPSFSSSKSEPSLENDNISSQSEKYKEININNGNTYDAVQKISSNAKLVQSCENSTGIKQLRIQITTSKKALLENAREFVHQMDSIRKECANEFIKDDYIKLIFSHKIVNNEDNCLIFMFDKEKDKYIISDENEKSCEMAAKLNPEYAKAFYIALDDMK